MHPICFPPTRRADPKRQAERSVFETLPIAAGQAFVYGERRRGYERVELDFAVGTEYLDLPDAIKARANRAYNPFVIPVLVFPDMEPDAAMENLATQRGCTQCRGLGIR